LLALCAGLDAIYSVVNFLMQDADGSLTLRNHLLKGTVVFMGRLAVAAGVCTIAAGIWRAQTGRSWLLIVNGLAFTALGLISLFWIGKLTLLPVALLLVAMAMSAGILELVTARTLRHHVVDRWLFDFAGAASIGFALAFFSLGFGWIGASHSDASFLWIGAYFGFSAICMLALALRLHGLRRSQSGQSQVLSL